MEYGSGRDKGRRGAGGESFEMILPTADVAALHILRFYSGQV